MLAAPAAPMEVRMGRFFSVVRLLGAGFAQIFLLVGVSIATGLVVVTKDGIAINPGTAGAASPAPVETAVTTSASASTPALAPALASLTLAQALENAADVGGVQHAPVVDRSGPPLQCAIYAQHVTGMDIRGEARTWWSAAEGRYERNKTPKLGSVIVMTGTSSSGHVAVVSRILNSREILIDHANWSNQGEIVKGALVVDVSQAGDWSLVRVWHPPTNSLGLSAFPVLGFVGPDPVGPAPAAASPA
jgi:CHAP domain